MDQAWRDDLDTLREERRLVLEQMRALQEEMKLLDERNHDLDWRLQMLSGGLESAAGRALLKEQQELARQMRISLRDQRNLLGRYHQLHRQRLALLELYRTTERG